MSASQPHDVQTFADATEWEAWLAAHHDEAPDVWLRIARKGASTRTITIDEALDVALCWGWIDSHRRKGDESGYLQRYSPRRRRSPWSAINAAKVDALAAAGRIQPTGQSAIDAARADGRWPGPP